MKYPKYIYKITNSINGKAYIGISDNPITRIENHLCNLKGGNHDVKEFNEDYAKYPKDCWEFEVLEVVNNKLQESREKWNQFFYRTIDKRYGYNTKEFIGSNRKRNNPYFPEAWSYIDSVCIKFLFEEEDYKWQKKILNTNDAYEKRMIRKARRIVYDEYFDKIGHHWDYKDIYENIHKGGNAYE